MNIYEVLLKEFKKSNSARKASMAKKYGYTADEFLKYLETQMGKPTVVDVKKLEKPVIHNVHILDASGSMHGAKFNNALVGINEEIGGLKLDDSVIYKQTTVDFSEAYDIKFHHLASTLATVGHFNSKTRGSTALLDAIVKTLFEVDKVKQPEDKVLVKIFTDGGENASSEYSERKNGWKKVKDIITEFEAKGYTITFVGTQGDVNDVQRKLNIDSSNTLVHDNTAIGVKMSFNVSRGATMDYVSKVKRGEDVKKGFYKKVGTL